MLVMILRSADIDVTGVSGYGQLASWLGKGSRGILCWGAEVDKLFNHITLSNENLIIMINDHTDHLAITLQY